MGYLMRFLSSSNKTITLADIEVTLKVIDPAYAITNAEIDDLGDLMYDNARYAIIEINRPGEDIFEDDLDAFREMLTDAVTDAERRVLQALTDTTFMVAVEVFWESENSEAALEKIDPLWDWLFDAYDGISQADNEGFYDKTGLIVERTFTL